MKESFSFARGPGEFPAACSQCCATHTDAQALRSPSLNCYVTSDPILVGYIAGHLRAVAICVGFVAFSPLGVVVVFLRS